MNRVHWGELATVLALLLIVGAAVTAVIAALTLDRYTTRELVHDLTLLAFASAVTALAWNHRRPWAHEHAGTTYTREP